MGKLIFTGLKAYRAEINSHAFSRQHFANACFNGAALSEDRGGEWMLRLPMRRGCQGFAMHRACALSSCWSLSFTVSHWKKGTKMILGIRGKELPPKMAITV